MQKNKMATLKSLLITAGFNTLIALVLAYMVMGSHKFIEVFIISQFVGLSICLFVTTALQIVQAKGGGWVAAGIVGGLMSGITVGGLLSWGLMALLYGMDLGLFLREVFIHIFIFGMVFGVPIIYFFASREIIRESAEKIQQEKIKRLTMEKTAAMTTLQLLQAQIEPHFLFNTLANVIALFEVDAQKAKQMLIDFNEYLRISLQRTRQEMITLDQELDLVRQYLEIFKIRMGPRLAYNITDRTGPDKVSFPPLIIQPLVENSIKYGLEPAVDGGRIDIDCCIQDDLLRVEIADTGLGLEADASQSGIGLNNVSQRLESIYGELASLVLKENKPSGMKAVIEVPVCLI